VGRLKFFFIFLNREKKSSWLLGKPLRFENAEVMGYGRGGGGAEKEKRSAKADFVVLDEVDGPGMCFLSLPLARFLCDSP
jgi:hypothetical protein